MILLNNTLWVESDQVKGGEKIEKMKMSVGTMAALVLVAVAVSALVINFGMVQAMEDKVKVSFKLDLKQKGDNVNVSVKAKGLATNVVFTVRAYSSTNCMGSFIAAIGSEDSAGKGNISIKGTIDDEVVGDVNSVSIRSPGGPGPLVQCFLNTTP